MSFYRNNIGKIGENKALLFLKNNHFKIIIKNFRSKFGEIDIIASKEKTVYFIEVKTRTNIHKGQPYEAVNYYKLKHMKTAAQYFLLKYPFKDYKLKLSVISIILNNEEIIDLKFFENIEF